jgi:hypothetical protein
MSKQATSVLKPTTLVLSHPLIDFSTRSWEAHNVKLSTSTALSFWRRRRPGGLRQAQISNPLLPTATAIIRTEQQVQDEQTQYIKLLADYMNRFTDTLPGEARAFRSAAPCHW